ncbi:MAG: putative nucleotidyltransferase substrate binding domain-containing protein [Syntrophorhabdaceae bacterium]
METTLKAAIELLYDDKPQKEGMADLDEALSSTGRFISDTLRWAMFMPTTLGLLGGFRVEDKGENAGMFNIGTHGIGPLVASVRAFSVSKGIYERSTLKCLVLLGRKGLISVDLEKKLAKAYDCFMGFLLRNAKSGLTKPEWVRPSHLAREDEINIREAMETVEHFQKYIYEDRIREEDNKVFQP